MFVYEYKDFIRPYPPHIRNQPINHAITEFLHDFVLPYPHKKINHSTTQWHHFSMFLFFPFYPFSMLHRCRKCLKNQPFNQGFYLIIAFFINLCYILAIHFLCYIDATNVWKIYHTTRVFIFIYQLLQLMFYPFYPFSMLHSCRKCLKNQPFNQGFYLIIAFFIYLCFFS